MFGRAKSEVELLQASRAGNTQAFEVVVGRYQSLVCAITYGATGDVGRSEELAQEAFLRAWTSLGQLKDLDKFRAWLCSIARSVVQNWFRSQRRDVVGHAAPLEVAAETASKQSGPEEAVMIEEQQAVVRQALAAMPEPLREPLILFYREGKSTREVAALMGLSEGAARQRIARGRSLLRAQVAGMVETTIARTRPGKIFTASVVAAIAAVGFKGSATAAAAGGVASGASALAAKVITAAVGVLAIVLGTVAYRQLIGPAEPPARPAVAQPMRAEPSGQSPSVAPVSENGLEGDVSPQPPDRSEPLGVTTTPEIRTGSGVSPAGRDRTSAVAGGKEWSEFEPRGVLSGRITDSGTGEPVTDAEVILSMGRAHTARTDANGFYHFDRIEAAGNYGIDIRSEEYLATARGNGDSRVHLSPDQQIVRHYQFARACMVDVWVMDANGAAIEGATVIGTSLAERLGTEVNPSMDGRRTDSNGYVLLGGFPPAQTEYLITAWWSEGTNPRTRGRGGYAPAKAVVRLTDPNVVRQIRIALESGQSVVGCAVYEDGLPATAIGIIATPAWWHCRYWLNPTEVRNDGTFTLAHIVPGVYDISSYVPTGGSGIRKVMQAQLPPADREPLVVRLAGAAPWSQVAISGSLIFRGEKRPSNVQIQAVSADGRISHARVKQKPDGSVGDMFVVDRLTPGTYRLRFSGRDMEDAILSDVIAPSSGVEVELVYAARPKLVGSVLEARTGEPIRDFRVRVKKLRTLRGPQYLPSNQWTHYQDERGHFSADSVGPGVYQVQVVAAGYAPAWSEQINTDEGPPTVVVLSPGGGISGRVVDERGEPVTGARVIPLSLAGGTMPNTEDVFVCEEGAFETVDGTFRLPHAPAGMETLQVIHPQYAPQIVPEVPVVADRSTDGIRIVLTEGGTVEGRVYDLQGKPIPGQVLSAQDITDPNISMYAEVGRLAQAITDANGFYRIEHLPERLCQVKRMDEQEGLGVLWRAVLPRNGQVTRVDLGGLPVVRGRVTIDGMPAARTRLRVDVVHERDTGAFRCLAITDDQGSFVFGGAPAGTYRLQREQPGEQAQWLAVGTITVGNDDVDLGALPAGTSSRP